TLRVPAVNDAALRPYGYAREEFLAMTIRDLRPPSEYKRLDAILQARLQGHSVHTEMRHRKKDGTLLDVEIATNDTTFGGRPARLVLASDVTERKQLENHFRQAQKMEAV